MSLIVAVKSCHRDRDAGFHDAIRATWGADLKRARVPVMFFVGQSPDPMFSAVLKSDEVIVASEDDYKSLPHKTRAITQWAMNKVVDHIFLCDNDTFVNAAGLLALSYQPFDYSGHFKGGIEEIGTRFHYQDHMGDYPDCRPWASGGMGYFLSKEAMYTVADNFPKFWAEDMYVGQVIGKEIEKGYLTGMALPMNGATSHYRKSPKDPQFTPDVLHRIYRDGGPAALYKESDAK